MRSSGLDATRPLPSTPHPLSKVVAKDATEINGFAVRVHLGQQLVVTMPPQSAGPLAWRVISVDRTLSQPQVGRAGEQTPRAGAKYSTTFTWDIGGPLMKAGGEHDVVLGYGRNGLAPEQTISFKVRVH